MVQQGNAYNVSINLVSINVNLNNYDGAEHKKVKVATIGLKLFNEENNINSFKIFLCLLI